MDSLLSTIISCILLVLLIIAILIRLKNRPSKEDKAAAEEFLKGFSDTFYKEMLNIINSMDISIYNNVEEFTSSMLSSIYYTLSSYIKDELAEAAQTDIVTALVLKVLDDKFITKFIESIIEKYNISEEIANVWESKIKENNNNAEIEDKELQDKFSSDEYNEDFDIKDLPSTLNNTEEDEEYNENINPQKDEPEEYSEDDESVEDIKIVTKKNKNGNTLYYIEDADGKLSRISKAEAEKYL